MVKTTSGKVIKSFVKWGTPTGGGFLTFKQIEQILNDNDNDYGKAIIAGIALVLVTFILTLFARFITKVYETVESEADNFAVWLSQNLVSLGIKFFQDSLLNFQQLTSHFQSRYYERLVQIYRQFQTKGLKFRGAVALELEDLFIPLRLAPEINIPSDLISNTDTNPIQQQQDTKGWELWDFIAEIPKESISRRIAILGSPGSGKTTLLQYITLAYAKKTQNRHHKKAPNLVPVILYLRDIRQNITSSKPQNLAELIENQESIKKLNPPQKWFENKLKNGKCLVMLDGLDEVADATQRQQVSDWICQQFKDEYPRTPFILTSRPFGFYNSGLEDVIETILAVQPYNLQDMEKFIQYWYLQNEIKTQREENPGIEEEAKRQADNLIYRIKNSPALAAMAFNPLLLTMISTVHYFKGSLPKRRVELYADICDVLLARRQEAKGIYSSSLTAAQKKSVLQVLALALMQQKSREFSIETGITLIKDKLVTVVGKQDNIDEFAKQFLKDIKDFSGLLVERELGIYEFAHQSFQEYLTAAQIKDANQGLLLIEHMNDPWCFETIRLYAAQADATEIIRAALINRNVDSLALAYDCLEEGLSIDSDVREQLERTLNEGISSSDPKIVNFAAQINLKRRLNGLLRLDENHAIDRSYINCAEYQLFIDEEHKSNQTDQSDDYLQPDHWGIQRFSPEEANQPITGVRGGDAEAFCQWLTKRYSGGEFNYRLPTIAEFQQNPLTHQNIGAWYKEGEKKVILGIDKSQWLIWNNCFKMAIDHDCGKARDFVRQRCSKLTLDPNRSQDLERPLAVSLTKIPLDSERVDHLCRQLSTPFAKKFNLIRVSKLSINLGRELFDEVNKIQEIIPKLTHEFSLSILQDLKPHQELIDMRIHVLLISVLWQLLLETMDKTIRSEDRNIFRSLQLTKNDCEKLKKRYTFKEQDAFYLYALLLLIHQRRENQIPAWEGIRIVREKIL